MGDVPLSLIFRNQNFLGHFWIGNIWLFQEIFGMNFLILSRAKFLGNFVPTKFSENFGDQNFLEILV